MLGGLDIDAEIRADHRGRALVELTPRGLPAQPATLERSRPRTGPVARPRLERRIGELPALAERLQQQRDEALSEADRA